MDLIDEYIWSMVMEFVDVDVVVMSINNVIVISCYAV